MWSVVALAVLSGATVFAVMVLLILAITPDEVETQDDDKYAE